MFSISKTGEMFAYKSDFRALLFADDNVFIINITVNRDYWLSQRFAYQLSKSK